MLSAFLLQASTNLAAAPQKAAGLGGPVSGYWPVMVFFAVAVVFPVLPVVLGRFVRPNLYGKAKLRPYECGIDPVSEAHDRFTVRFYIVAMLFLVFDVETIFLLPWAIIFMGDDFSFTRFALLEMFFFIGILVVGYYYAWRKGALEWA
jgi:NADH-quinone oxidoreductase subunit A